MTQKKLIKNLSKHVIGMIKNPQHQANTKVISVTFVAFPVRRFTHCLLQHTRLFFYAEHIFHYEKRSLKSATEYTYQLQI